MTVAYYRCEVKTIKRSQGHAATAAAAYRSGSKLYDSRTGLTHDYQRKQGVEYSAVIAPTEAAWVTTREDLWNRAEQAETRGNARVAREVLVCFPHQLERDERIEVATQFGHWLSEEYGVAVDVSLHQPEHGNDDRNYHAHVLISTREATADGFGKKTRVLDDKRQGPEEVKRIRKAWADTVNHQLERSGRNERVDHRSNQEQGIERLPQVHLGKAVLQMEGRGISTEMMARYKRIAAANDNCRQLREQIAALERELAEEVEKDKRRKRIKDRYRRQRREHRGRLRHRRQRLERAGRRGRRGRNRLDKSMRYRLTAEQRTEAIDAFAEGYLKAHSQGQRGAQQLDWKACQHMGKQGFKAPSIKFALQTTSPNVQGQRQKAVAGYVHKTAHGALQSQEVQQAKAKARDARRQITQFLQFYDRERTKPLNEAHLLRRYQQQFRQLLSQLGRMEENTSDRTKTMAPLPGFLAWAVTAARNARSATSVYKTVKRVSERAKRQNDKKLEQQKLEQQKTQKEQAPQQKKSEVSKTPEKKGNDPKSVTADKKSSLQKAEDVTEEVQAIAGKKSQLQKAEDVTEEVQAIAGKKSQLQKAEDAAKQVPGVSGEKSKLQKAQEVTEAVQEISASRNSTTPKAGDAGGSKQQPADPVQEPSPQDPIQQNLVEGMAYGASDAKVKEIAEQVTEDNIQPQDLNYEQQYSVLRTNLENFDAEQVSDPESDVDITEKMIKVGKFRAQEEQPLQDHKGQIIDALAERSPHAAKSEDAFSYAENAFSEALGRVEAQNFKPDNSVYEVFDSQYHTQEHQRTLEAMQMLNDGPELGD